MFSCPHARVACRASSLGSSGLHAHRAGSALVHRGSDKKAQLGAWADQAGRSQWRPRSPCSSLVLLTAPCSVSARKHGGSPPPGVHPLALCSSVPTASSRWGWTLPLGKHHMVGGSLPAGSRKVAMPTCSQEGAVLTFTLWFLPCVWSVSTSLSKMLLGICSNTKFQTI